MLFEIPPSFQLPRQEFQDFRKRNSTADFFRQSNGNNDLANIDPTLLGNGDDSGKSNSFYFHVFYCYEVDNFGNTAYPIVCLLYTSPSPRD